MSRQAEDSDQPTSISLSLLDPVKGHALQTWTFAGRDVVTIGRGPENDVVVLDPYVSRKHAELQRTAAGWTLTSHGRHGTLVDDARVERGPLADGAILQFGSSGPSMRFTTSEGESRRRQHSSTMDIDTFLLQRLEVDEQQKEEEVSRISNSPAFDSLREQARRLREGR